MALSTLSHPFELDNGEDAPPTHLERAIAIADKARDQLEQAIITLGRVNGDLPDVSREVTIENLICTLCQAGEDLSDVIHAAMRERGAV